MKEVKEGDSFNFEITVKNSFKLDKVTDQNNNTIQPKKVDGNVYTYKIADVKSDKTFHVLYWEETNSDKSKTDVNKSGDNKKDDADASDDGESDSKAAKSKAATQAASGAKAAVQAATETTPEDTDTEKWITVGNSVKLTSNYGTRYTHTWTIKDESIVSKSGSGNSITVTGKKVGETTVTDTVTWGYYWSDTVTYKVHVLAAVAPTAISISGADKVTQFKTINLGYTLTPSNASGKVHWSSSNERILTVDSNGTVSGLRQGTATVTASVQGSNDTAITATKTIKVVANTQSTDRAIVYYLLDPTKDANSNDSLNWGPQSGIATVNVTNATWTNGKNCFDNVDQRVVSWPNGTNVVTKGSDAWNQIFDNYRSSIQSQLGLTITKDDVEEITLVPAKISKNNGTNPDKHLDCNVNIRCKNVATVKYYLYDAGGTNFDMLGSKNYIIKRTSTTKPADVTTKEFPETKTVNGVTYTFSGWYTNRELTNAAPDFPAEVTTSVTYYAKYIAGYQVMYNLAGGSFSDGSTSAAEKHNEGTNVVVRTEPTRKGYTFTGWTVEGLDVSTINSGDNFKMPGNTVKLTANWKAKNIKDYVSLTTEDVTEKYDGQPHPAGQATAAAKVGKDNKDIGNLKIEYQIPGTDTWTTDFSKITATNVSESTTVKVRVTSDDLLGELTGTEKLTITKRDVTLTSASDEKVYDGQPLTNKNVTASRGENEGFVDGEGATYKVTGTITNVGEKPNAFTYKLKENTKEENYNISTKNGTLKVTPVTTEVKVKITGHQNAVTYDGIKHTVTGYDVTEISNTLYTANDFTFSGKAEAAGTDAATYPMGLKTSQFKNKNANFTKVTFEVVDGSLTINPRQITLKSASDSKAYDKKPLTNHNVEIVSGEFVSGEGIDKYNVTGSQTEVGTSDNTFEYTLNDKTKAKNYQITKEPGQLTVTKNAQEIVVTIKENSGKETYDGTEKSVSGYTVESIKRGGENTDVYTEEDFQIKNSAKATVKGKNAGSYDMNLTPDDFENINDRFENVTFVIVDGKLTIEKRKVTLTSADASKEYDGEPLTSNKITVGGEDGFVENEGVTYTVTGAQTAVGSSANSFTYIAKDGTNLDNYDIIKTEGRLTVKKNDTLEVNVYITGHTDSKMYNGKEQSVTDYDVTTSNGLYTTNDFEFKGTAKAAGTDAGDYAMGLKASDFTNTSKNFSKVKFVVKDGNLTITKRDVTLKTADAEKVYDGTALKNNEVTVGGDGFATGEGAAYDVTGSRTNVGESDNTFTYKLNKGTKADNYDITTKEGTLKVTPVTDKVTVKIKGNNDKFKYDGSKKTVEGYKVVDISNKLYTEKDFEFSGTDKVSGTDAGSYDMGMTAGDFANISKNFANVVFEVEDGQLVIEKRKVTMTSDSGSKAYDGEALTKKHVTESEDGFVKGEGAAYDVTGSQLYVGESDNEFTYKLNKGTKADNYDITVVKGKLTVTASKEEVVVTITENSGTYKYDGTEKSVTGYKVTSINNKLYSKDDFEFSGNDKVSGTDAGSYDMNLKASDFKNTNKNFDNVKFVIVDGTLTIEKRKVTMTSEDAGKTYDGTALTNKTVNESGDGFAEGEGATYDVTGTQTNAGSSDNTFTYKLNKGTKADNYIIETKEGKLTVTPVTAEVTVNIKEHSGKKLYNGSEQSVSGYDVTNISNALYKVKDFEFGGNDTVSGTNAGSYDMNITPADFKNISKNFTNVKFVIEDGKLVIEKRNVTLTSASAERVYDGKALTNDTVKVSGDGFVLGEGATYSVTGSQLDAGESDNAFTYKLFDNTSADNYIIKTEKGKLKVTPVTDEVVVTVKGNSKDATYDGDEKTAEGYKVTDISNSLYTDNDFTFTGDASVKATDAGQYWMDVKSSDFTNISKNFTNVRFVFENGVLTIGKRNVILTSASDSKAYDGKPLTNDEVAVGGEGFAKGEGAAYDVTGSQLNVGTSDNTFTYELNANTKADNYNIELVEGKLTVTADENEVVVTITENRGRNKYDGRKHKVTGYEVTAISNKLYTAKDFTFNGKAEVTGTDAGTYDMDVKADDFENVNNNFAKVTFVIIDGKLTIEKRDVTLTSADASKVYNGTALTSKKVTVSGEGFAKGEGATYNVTGTRTNTGTSKNTFTYTLKNGTKAANYNIKKVEGKLTITAAAPVKPNTPNTPENSTPQNRNVVQRVVTSVRNVPSRIARAVQETGAKVRELVNAGDNNVPLGNQKLDDHKCCVLHFLIMLLTAILYGFFTHNLKKRQKKLFEVREELDTELAKRGLPTTKEQKQQ